MSIINTQSSVATVVQNMRQANGAIYDVLRFSLEKSFNDIWCNAEYSPQDIFNGFGADAAGLFIAAGKTIELLMSIDPTYVPPSAPSGYIINNDGTVTVK